MKGVSQWKQEGLEYGYWAFFEREVKDDAVEEILHILEKINEEGTFLIRPEVFEILKAKLKIN